MSAAVMALLTGQDVEIAARSGATAVDNNLIPLLLTVGGCVWAGYNVYSAYRDGGPKEALKQLGVEVTVQLVGGVVGHISGKVLYKVGSVCYPTARAALDVALEKNPALKLALGQLTDKIIVASEKIEGSLIGRATAKLEESLARAQTRATEKIARRLGFRPAPAGVPVFGIDGLPMEELGQAIERGIEEEAILLAESVERKTAHGAASSSASAGSSSSQPSASSSSSSAAPSAPPATTQPGVQSTVVPAKGVAPDGSIQLTKSLPKSELKGGVQRTEQGFGVQDPKAPGGINQAGATAESLRRAYQTEERAAIIQSIEKTKPMGLFVKPEQAKGLGFRGDQIKKLVDFDPESGFVRMNTQIDGGMKKAEELMQSIRSEFANRGALDPEIYVDQGRKYYAFADGSSVQIRDIGKSGQPKIEISDVLRNIFEKITCV
jgi:hypothetical protein